MYVKSVNAWPFNTHTIRYTELSQNVYRGRAFADTSVLNSESPDLKYHAEIQQF
jgi:hypothetical protein